MSIYAGAQHETLIVRRQNAGDLIALFGEAWREPTGPFRITGGRMDGGVVRISLAGPGRSVSMWLQHKGSLGRLAPGAVVVEQPASAIVAVLVCTPACDAAALVPLRNLAERVLGGHPDRLWVPARGLVVGRERAAAVVLASGLAGLAVLFGLVALWRARPLGRRQLAEAALLCVCTYAATVLLGEPSVANWYSNNLPAAGGIFAAEDQNGMAGFLLQAVVRALLPWTDRTLFGLNLCLHALAGGVFYLAFRALLVDRAVAGLGLLLWMVLPLSVRIGWSDAQHVQVELLFAVLLLAWLRAQDGRNWPERWLAPVLAALLPLVRLEAMVLAPVPLLFGPLVGNRPLRKRLLDASLYGALLALSIAAVFALFVRRYDIPVRDPASQLRVMVGLVGPLFRQFVFVPSGMPNWFPLPVTVLLVIGVLELAAQPGQLAAFLGAFCIPQLLLGRLFNAEGMVGARYFLPLLALLALVAAYGLRRLDRGLQHVLARCWPRFTTAWTVPAVAALAVSVVVGSARPLYHYQYAFQGEERFLRQALAALPAEARVLHLPAREDDYIHTDPDCCLDPPNSPLAAAFPALRFETIPLRPENPRLPAAVDDRTYYYEGALCSLAPTASSEGRNPGLSGLLNQQCAALRRDPRLEPLAAARVPSNGFWAFFAPGEVPLRLYRIRPAAPSAGP